MTRRHYDFPGDPELAHLIASKADEHGTWITAIDDHSLPIFYATTNMWEYLGKGLDDKKWISIGVCQTADTEDNLRLGRALGETIALLIILRGTQTAFSWSLFDGGYTFASKIAATASEFNDQYKAGAYIAAGLVLFILTFVVNSIARAIVNKK